MKVMLSGRNVQILVYITNTYPLLSVYLPLTYMFRIALVVEQPPPLPSCQEFSGTQ